MTLNQRRALVAALAAAGPLIYVFGVPFARGFFSPMRAVSFHAADDADMETVVALAEFFDNNTVAIGSDGATAWDPYA